MTKQSSCDWSTSSEFEDLSSRITSEKEILALFEKMMVSLVVQVQFDALVKERCFNVVFPVLLFADCHTVHVFFSQ